MISRRWVAASVWLFATAAAWAADPPKEPAFAERALSRWIADLDDADGLIREEAIEVLGRMGADARPALGRLEKLSAGDTDMVRRRAAVALWKIDGRVQPARDLFQAHLKEARGWQRLQAVQTLRQLGSPAAEVAPHLVDLILDPDYAVSNPATMLLQQMGADGVPALAAALPKARGDTRNRLLNFITGLGPLAKPLVPGIKEMLQDKEARTRIAAVRTLWSLNEDRPNLTKLVVEIAAANDLTAKNDAINFAIYAHPKPKEFEPVYREAIKAVNTSWRYQAIQALWEIDPKSLKDNLKVLTDGVKEVGRNGYWYTAVQVIGAIGPDAKDALPALLEALDHPDGYNNAYMLAPAIARMGPAAVDPLVKHLTNTNQQLQMAARQALQTVGVEAVPKLIPLLKEKDSRVRMEVLTILAGYGSAGKEGVPQLIELIKDSDQALRARALALLTQMGPDAAPATPELVKLVAANANPSEFPALVRALGQIGPAASAAVPELTKHLSDKQGHVRMEAAEALLRIQPDSKKEALAVLTEMLRKKEAGLNVGPLVGQMLANGVPPAELFGLIQDYVKAQPNAKQALASTLTNAAAPAKEAAPLLRELVKETNPNIRNEAAFALAKLGEDGKDAIPVLRALLSQANFSWRDRAVTALSTLGPSAKEALPELMELWRSPAQPDLQARYADAILAIDKEKNKSVLEGLRTQAATAQPYQRLAALKVLARHAPKDPELLKSLLGLARDPSSYYSALAFEAIGLMGVEAKSAVGEVRAAMKDDNVIKRVRAATALWKIEGKPEDAMPVLTAALTERDPVQQGNYYTTIQRTGAMWAAVALGEIGPRAQEALPALRKAAGLGDPLLKQHATAAIAKIEKK